MPKGELLTQAGLTLVLHPVHQRVVAVPTSRRPLVLPIPAVLHSLKTSPNLSKTEVSATS